jgi:hypothetical protein
VPVIRGIQAGGASLRQVAAEVTRLIQQQRIGYVGPDRRLHLLGALRDGLGKHR